jgi:hypothetical protein
MEDQVRYKMAEVAPPIYLFPDDQGVVKEKEKAGCPFGYTSETKAEDIKSPFSFNFENIEDTDKKPDEL